MNYSFTYGGKDGKKHVLAESDSMLVLRTKNARGLNASVLSDDARSVIAKYDLETSFPEADVYVLKPKDAAYQNVEKRDTARRLLKQEPDLRFTGRVLVDPANNSPVVYTENIFIKFKDDLSTDSCEKILAAHGLTVRSRPHYAKNTFFVSAPVNTGLKVFDIANSLLELPAVELCHPELVRQKALKQINSKQWHLISTQIDGQFVDASANVKEAHKVARGEGITIAIIDDGVEIGHPEFNITGKVHSGRDMVEKSSDPNPKGPQDKHGHACAGVALAAGLHASGVAPAARLMPIRLAAQLGSQAEADAFVWAADNGADVISCSWGPADGHWWDPADPRHTTQTGLPDSTREAIDYAATRGRNGKGCVIVFAAGNGNEDVMFDGYASYEKVIAVAACNDFSKRSIYSDFGAQVWCCFPSSDFGDEASQHPEPRTNGIYTTDRSGKAGYSDNGYTDTFGGTSSSCPGVAGVAALILSINPDLSRTEVREILKNCCDQIDAVNGTYDQSGHSKHYGYGRVNAEKAVLLAKQTVAKQITLQP